jgi:hypothetical protein
VELDKDRKESFPGELQGKAGGTGPWRDASRLSPELDGG